MTVKLCKCAGNRDGQHLARFHGAPLDRGGHTDFILIRCAKCQKLWGSPRKNFKLAVLTGTPWLWVTIQLVAHYSLTHSS